MRVSGLLFSKREIKTLGNLSVMLLIGMVLIVAAALTAILTDFLTFSFWLILFKNLSIAVIVLGAGSIGFVILAIAVHEINKIVDKNSSAKESTQKN